MAWRRRSNTVPLSIDQIYHVVVSDRLQPLNIIYKIQSLAEENESSNINSSTSTADDSSLFFEDSLQAIENSTRPSTMDHVQHLTDSILKCIILANDNEQKWKLILLTILRKRYHMKSPLSKGIQKKENINGRDGKDTTTKEKEEKEDTSGHGERIIFYIFNLALYHISLMEESSSADMTEMTSNVLHTMVEYSSKACHCLTKLAIQAGGTRDVCYLVEYFVHYHLITWGIMDIRKDEGNRRGIVAALKKVSSNTSASIFSSVAVGNPSILQDLIKAAANLLDGDFSLIATTSTAMDSNKMDELQSTINTYVPHHDRGTRNRKLTQSLAEYLIWIQTKHAQTDYKFVQAKKAIHEVVSSTTAIGDTVDDKIILSLHILQTSIRRFRQKLNVSSRNQGFSLCSSYTMDSTSITLSMVKRGREGDVMNLQKLATKKVDDHTMKLISLRNSDPSKAIPVQSMRQLHNNWVPFKEMNEAGGEDEIRTLQLKIQEATVRATIELLKSKIPKNMEKKKIIIASLDRKVENDCAAIIVAAALGRDISWDDDDDEQKTDDEVESDVLSPSIFIQDDKYSITTSTHIMHLLDKVVANKENNVNEPATTKDVQNLIDRHLEPESHLLLFTSTDIKIEQQILSNLQSQGNTIHCHMNDDFSFRMQRENAKVGDITITLAWDNECDLDLHCICPNGDHISYSSKEGGGDIGGGYLDVDMNVNGESQEPVENIFFGDAERGIEAAKGKYKVFVQNFGYHGNTITEGEPVPWRLRLIKNGDIHNYTGFCSGAGESSNVTAVEFEYGGRKVSPPEEVGSALVSSNLVSITSSVGDTLDAITNLLSIFQEHTELSNMQVLLQDENANTDTDTSIRPLMADGKSFDITNRDRLYLKLSKLPKLFHVEVNTCFYKSISLMDFCAAEIAYRLAKDQTPIKELKRAGYQDEMIDAVKKKMKMHGMN